VKPTLFDITYLFEEFEIPQDSWNSGTMRYAREISLELDVQRSHNCYYVSRKDNYQKSSFLKKKIDFPLWKSKSKKDFQEDSSYFFPSIGVVFPKELKGKLNFDFFVTIYDLIPLLYPEYCTIEFNVRFRELLQSYVTEEQIHFFCISENTKKDFCSLTGINPNKVTITLLAADKEKFYVCQSKDKLQEIRETYNIGNSPYFLYLSRFEQRKNHKLLFQAFLLFIRKHPDSKVKLILLGRFFDRILIKDLVDFILKEELEKHIYISWFAKEKDLASLMSNCLSFLYPSLYEGFGLPALEAMQCGAPIIASNTSSMPEVIGDAGILLPPNNELLWMQAMERVYESKKLQQELSEKSLERASLFSWKKTVSKMLETFESK
jgi:glycosyltransferase involved in cell wall biosynthesis